MKIEILKRYSLPISLTALLFLLMLLVTASKDLLEPTIILRGYAPLVVFILALGFCALVAQIIFRLAQTETAAEAAAAETSHILASVNEGLFLIDRDYQIGRQRSQKVEEIFGDDVDINGNFFELLFKVSPKIDITLAREYVDLLMAGRVKQKLMRDINPLQEVPIETKQLSGASVKKYLHIEFTRDESAEASNAQARALVSITDVTKQVLLQDELVQTKEQQKERLNLLLSVVKVNSEQLEEFFTNTKSELVEINSVLAQEGAEHRDNVQKLNTISTMIHRLKGEASALSLDFFESAFHQFEDSIATVQRNMFIDGRDMMSLTVQLKEIINELESVQAIAPQLRSVGASPIKAAEPEISSIPERLLEVAKRAADNEGKHVDVACTGFELLADKPEFARKLDSMAIQLVRNSVVHGIETPAERLELNKSPLGMIRVNLARDEKNYKMSVLDDGRGIDFDRIREKVAELLKMTPSQAEQLDRGKLLHYIFQSGFSSLDAATVDGGRGVGLSLVRDQANAMGGRIAVKSTPQKYCQFGITIPINPATPKVS